VPHAASGLLSDWLWCFPAPYWSTHCLILLPICFQTDPGAVLRHTGPLRVSCYFRVNFRLTLVLPCAILVHPVSHTTSDLLSDWPWCCPATYWSTQCLILLPVCFQTDPGAVLHHTGPPSVSCYFRFAFRLTLVLSCAILVHTVSHVTSGLFWTDPGAVLRHTGPPSASCYFRFAFRLTLVLSCALLVHSESHATSGLLLDWPWCCAAPYWSTQCFMLLPVCF